MKLNIYVLLLIFLVILMYFQPSFLGNLCTNCFGKATLILLIVFLAIQDISLAILASVVLISSMHLVSREGFKENLDMDNVDVNKLLKNINRFQACFLLDFEVIWGSILGSLGSHFRALGSPRGLWCLGSRPVWEAARTRKGTCQQRCFRAQNGPLGPSSKSGLVSFKRTPGSISNFPSCVG